MSVPICCDLITGQDKISKSKELILQALALDPYDSNFYGVLANINLREKDWELALKNANEGLAIESENIECLNARAQAYIKLDRKEEAYETIKEALHFNPENSHTHSNIGWGLIEKREYQKSLYHFKEALSIDPSNEHAKAGLVEALKAKYWFYRLFLRYAFWIGNMKTQAQWIVIIGFYVGAKLVDFIGEKYPALQIITVPLIILYVIFALTTWVITPLSNLFLRLNVYGKYALGRNEIVCSNYIGISILISIVSGILYFLIGGEYFLILCIVGFAMMIPISGLFNATSKSKGRNILLIYTLALGVLGLSSVAIAATGGSAMNPITSIFILAIITYQWIANAILIK